MPGQLLDGENSITSKSKFLKYKLTMNSFKEIGIKLNVNIPAKK